MLSTAGLRRRVDERRRRLGALLLFAATVLLLRLVGLDFATGRFRRRFFELERRRFVPPRFLFSAARAFFRFRMAAALCFALAILRAPLFVPR